MNELYNEHIYRKSMRARSMMRQRHAVKRRVRMLKSYRRNVYFTMSLKKYPNENGEYIESDLIKRAKISKAQHILKKQAQKHVRRAKELSLSGKSNNYKLLYDYWWILD